MHGGEGRTIGQVRHQYCFMSTLCASSPVSEGSYSNANAKSGAVLLSLDVRSVRLWHFCHCDALRPMCEEHVDRDDLAKARRAKGEMSVAIEKEMIGDDGAINAGWMPLSEMRGGSPGVGDGSLYNTLCIFNNMW